MKSSAPTFARAACSLLLVLAACSSSAQEDGSAAGAATATTAQGASCYTGGAGEEPGAVHASDDSCQNGLGGTSCTNYMGTFVCCKGGKESDATCLDSTGKFQDQDGKFKTKEQATADNLAKRKAEVDAKNATNPDVGLNCAQGGDTLCNKDGGKKATCTNYAATYVCCADGPKDDNGYSLPIDLDSSCRTSRGEYQDADGTMKK